jgi:hypothetical protein
VGERVDGPAGVGDLGRVGPTAERPTVAVEDGLGGGVPRPVVGEFGDESSTVWFGDPEAPLDNGIGVVVATDQSGESVLGLEEAADLGPGPAPQGALDRPRRRREFSPADRRRGYRSSRGSGLR